MPKLSILERLGIQKVIAQKLATLRGGELSLMDKLKEQKAISENLKKLGSDAQPKAQPELPAANENESPFTELLAGKFNGLDIPGFVLKLDDAYLNESDLGKAKQSAIQYIEANRESLEAA